MKNIYKVIARFFMSVESPLMRVVIVIPAMLIASLIFIISIFNNPFSDFSNGEIIDYLVPVKGKVDLSKDIYYYKQESVEVKSEAFGQVEIETWDGILYVNPTELEKDPHPMPCFSTAFDSRFVLGTTQGGIDFLSTITDGILVSFKLIFVTLFSFLLLGISISIVTEYFNTKSIVFKSIIIIFSNIQKVLEAIPILIWVLLSIIFVGYFSDVNDEQKQLVIFFLFGIFSSPALSKLISAKIIELKDEDFVYALKLSGISNFRIIFYHIIRYFCIPIILLQSCYIIIQTLFLDISLAVMGLPFNRGLGVLTKHLEESSYYLDRRFLVITIIIELSFIVSFYYAAKYFESRSKT
ncbi:MAG: hypothetical protein H8E71_04155 [Candidatus Marinimicrobia bacterium]|nr:hypothetical protein [Candidatus Neomarinimicrobiota bacterium]